MSKEPCAFTRIASRSDLRDADKRRIATSRVFVLRMSKTMSDRCRAETEAESALVAVRPLARESAPTCNYKVSRAQSAQLHAGSPCIFP